MYACGISWSCYIRVPLQVSLQVNTIKFNVILNISMNRDEQLIFDKQGASMLILEYIGLYLDYGRCSR